MDWIRLCTALVIGFFGLVWFAVIANVTLLVAPPGTGAGGVTFAALIHLSLSAAAWAAIGRRS